MRQRVNALALGALLVLCAALARAQSPRSDYAGRWEIQIEPPSGGQGTRCARRQPSFQASAGSVANSSLAVQSRWATSRSARRGHARIDVRPGQSSKR